MCEMASPQSIKGSDQWPMIKGPILSPSLKRRVKVFLSRINSPLTICWARICKKRNIYVSASFTEWIHQQRRPRRGNLVQRVESFRVKLGSMSPPGFYPPSITLWRATDQSYASCWRQTQFWQLTHWKFSCFGSVGNSFKTDSSRKDWMHSEVELQV